MLGILFVIITGLLWAAFGALASYATRRGIHPPAMLAGAAALSVTLAWALVPRYSLMAAGPPARWGVLVAVMVTAGVLGSSGVLAMQRGFSLGPHGVVWTIGQSALVMPFLVGITLFAEPVAWPRLVGVGLVVVCLVLLGRANHGGDGGRVPARRWLWPALLGFACLGAQQSLSTVPSYWRGWEDAAHLRIPLTLTGSFLCYLTAALIARSRIDRRSLVLGLAVSAITLGSLFLFYRGLDALQAVHMVSLGYPIAVGTAIVTFAAYSRLVLRERSSPAGTVGLLVGLVGVVLTAVRW